LKYSLQIATTRSYDIDVVEGDKFMRRVKEIIIHAMQLMFLDETAKGKNSGRRRRHWSRQGLTPSATSILMEIIVKHIHCYLLVTLMDFCLMNVNVWSHHEDPMMTNLHVVLLMQNNFDYGYELRCYQKQVIFN